MALATLSIDLIANMALFERDMQKVTRSVQTAANDMGAAFGTVKAGIAGLVGAFTVGFAVNFVKQTITGVDALNDLHDATGASVENISALEDVAIRSGNSFESMATSLVKFNKVLLAATPGSEMEKTLASIGLSARELRKMDPADALVKAGKALATYAEDGNRARLTQEFFGKSIRETAPWMRDLADNGLLVAKVTTEQAQRAEDFNKALGKVGKNATDASRTLIGDYLPAMNKILEAIAKGGLTAGINEFGNRVFDWEGNQARKTLKAYERDLKDLQQIKDGITFDLFGSKGEVDAKIAATSAALEAAKRKYFGLGDGNAGRGKVNPSLVDARSSAPEPPGTKVKSAADIAAEAGKKLALSLTAVDAEMSPDFFEKWNQLGAAYKASAISLNELVLAQKNLLSNQPFEKQAVAAAKKFAEARQELRIKEDESITQYQREQVESEVQFWREIIASTPTAKLEAQQRQVSRLSEGLSAGRFGDPASAEAVKSYGEAVRVTMGFTTDAAKETNTAFEELGLTFSSAFESATISGKGLREVLKGLGDDILRIALRKTVTEPLANAASGFFKSLPILSFLGIPGHATGLANVPYDNYVARLHKGERVLTAEENRNGTGTNVIQFNINASVGNIASKDDVVAGMRAAMQQTLSTLSRSQRFGGASA